MNLRTRQIFAGFFMLTLMAQPLMAQGTSTDPKAAALDNIGKRDINKGNVNFTSLESEVRIGRLAAAELERSFTIVDDGEINSYVDRIAQKIAKNSDARLPVTIKVIQSENVNAIALPGGFIYVNTGTIKAVDNEAELAFVIAHLVGHVAARHATESNSKGVLMQVGQIPASILTGGVLGSTIQELPQTAGQSTVFRFSRGAIKEADFLGLQYLYLSGYDPTASIGFFRKLEGIAAAVPKQSSIFNTHPPTADRIKLMEKSIKTLLPIREKNILNTPEFDAILVRVP